MNNCNVKYTITRPGKTNDDDEVEIELEVSGNAEPYVHAKLYGLPEDCYPSEGGIAHIESALDSDGKDWSNELNENERNEIENLLYESFEECNDY